MSLPILFSIIIPTYNSASTLAKCLRAIASQTFKNFEVLIVDGQSSDETLTIAKQFDHQMLMQVNVNEDEGIYDAMNSGILKAKGEFLYFLGSDDALFHPQTLEQIAVVAQQNPLKVIYGNVEMLGTSSLVKNGTIYGGAFNLKRLMVHNIPHQAIFYPKIVFQEIGAYNTAYRILADHDLNLRAMSRFDFLHVDQIIAFFAVGGASTQQVDTAFERDKVRNFLSYFTWKLHKKEFVELRYYIKEAALNGKHHVPTHLRSYALLVYIKLKLQSLLN